MWTNLTNDKCYIGSAVDLPNRLSFYYSKLSMENLLKRSQSHICSALLKYGHYNFSLIILEYCEPDKCLEIEGYYWKLFKPEYNIAQDPTAPFYGRTHSDASKTKISPGGFGMLKKAPLRARVLVLAARRENNPMYNKPRPKGAGNPSQAIEVTNIKNNTTINYDSMHEAARALNINKGVIDMYFLRNQKKPYKGLYTFKKI